MTFSAFSTKNYPYQSDRYEVTLEPGLFRFELWGSEGGGSVAGKGAYVAGTLKLNKKQTFFLYTGGMNGENGGASSNRRDVFGGGSTDIRLVDSDSFEGYASRIIVAGGGGSGSEDTKYKSFGRAGNAGGINGSSASYEIDERYDGKLEFISLAEGATQINGREGGECFYNIACVEINTNGSFFHGGVGVYYAGGGGYFGGGGGIDGYNIIGYGAGGSSFVSGYKDCLAIDTFQSTEESISMKSNSFHDSNFVFKDIIFLSGSDVGVPTLDGSTETGHTGNGMIRISLIYPPFIMGTCQMPQLLKCLYLYVVILFVC